jgi:hypothetical protein
VGLACGLLDANQATGMRHQGGIFNPMLSRLLFHARVAVSPLGSDEEIQPIHPLCESPSAQLSPPKDAWQAFTDPDAAASPCADPAK